jgi:hypothetical protein
VSHTLARLIGPLLAALWPASGRHRLPTARHARRPVRTAHTAPEPARPYAHLCRAHPAQARLQRARRRALWLAVHGIDVGPSLIHGVEVGA